MNLSSQSQSIKQQIIDLIPLLVKLGSTQDPIVIPESMVPNPWDFGVYWKQWDRVVAGWEAAKVADLIKGFTYLERNFNCRFGSVPPVANLFLVYSSLVEVSERDRLAEWVLVNTVNEYAPYGTHNHGARSLAELKEKQAARMTRSQAMDAQEQVQFETNRARKIQQATERLPNALRRKDAKAVAALIAKGADVDALSSSGQSARAIAEEMGIDSWLSADALGEQ